jgi:hypothetical protein
MERLGTLLKPLEIGRQSRRFVLQFLHPLLEAIEITRRVHASFKDMVFPAIS